MKILIVFCAHVAIDVEIGFDGNYLSQLLLLIFLYFYFLLCDFICDFDNSVNDHNCNSLYLWL